MCWLVLNNRHPLRHNVFRAKVAGTFQTLMGVVLAQIGLVNHFLEVSNKIRDILRFGQQAIVVVAKVFAGTGIFHGNNR